MFLKIKFYCLTLITLLAYSQFAISQNTTRKFSGSIELPDNRVAEKVVRGNVTIESPFRSNEDIIINVGQSSAEFELNIPAAIDEFILTYSCWSNCDGIVSRAFHTGEKFSAEVNDIRLINDFSIFDKPLEMLSTSVFLVGIICRIIVK